MMRRDFRQLKDLIVNVGALYEADHAVYAAADDIPLDKLGVISRDGDHMSHARHLYLETGGLATARWVRLMSTMRQLQCSMGVTAGGRMLLVTAYHAAQHTKSLSGQSLCAKSLIIMFESRIQKL